MSAPPYLRGQDGQTKERLRQFFAVWLETDSAEDAMWVVLQEDRRQRGDNPRRTGDGRMFRRDDPVIPAIVKAAAEEAGLSLDSLLTGRRLVDSAARGVAMRALRDEGYSYRAISRALGKRGVSCTVLQSLGRVAARRELVEAAVRVRRRARRRCGARVAA